MKKQILLMVALTLATASFAGNKNKKAAVIETVPDTAFTIDLWQKGLPNTNGIEKDGYNDNTQNFKPCIKVFLPQKRDSLCKAVVICPGGGYSHLAMTHEGYDWAKFYNDRGVAVIVLKYRMPRSNREVPMSDAKEALRIVHEKAGLWKIDRNNIGIMGSSAGGHLASTIATHVTDSVKPAFQILFYPVISMRPELTHYGSMLGFLGQNPSEENLKLYSNDEQVTEATPRAFIVLAYDDNVVKPMNSINYFTQLLNKKVPAAMFIYPSGGHGFGFRPSYKYHDALLMELTSWLKTF